MHESLRKAGFDPNQSRNEGGRWSGGGSAPPIGDHPPEWKRKVVRPEHWREIKREIERRGDLSESERFAYSETFAAEGGLGIDKSGAASGIHPDTYSRMRQRAMQRGDVPDHLTPDHPSKLTTEQRVAFYKHYYDTEALHRAGGSAALNRIPDPYTASAVGDTVFRHGGGDDGNLVRDAANDVINSLGPRERAALGLEHLNGKGVLKPDDMRAIETIAGGEHSRTFRNRLSQRRINAKPKEPGRADHFRYRDK